MQDIQLYREKLSIKKVQKNKKNIASALYAWAGTFDFEVDDECEPSTEARDLIFDLAERLENGNCNEQDYKEILFHIEQINCGEVKIKL